MDIEYLKTSIGVYLSRALTELAVRRPERPVEYLAYYLIALHEKELELQKAEQKKKEKSSIRLKVTAPSSSTNKDLSSVLSEIMDKCASSTNQVVSSVLSEIMDKCADLYDPQVKDSFIDILKSGDIDIPDRRLTAPTIIDDASSLDENLLRLVIDDGNKEFTAEVQSEIPYSYELNTDDHPDDRLSLSQNAMIPGASTNNLHIDSD